MIVTNRIYFAVNVLYVFIVKNAGVKMVKKYSSIFKTGSKGNDHHQAKLNEEKVRFIRMSNLSIKELASMYGVSKSCINNARSRHTWSHIE